MYKTIMLYPPVDSARVSTELQNYVSDLIYRIFYSIDSEIRKSFREGASSPDVIQAILVKIFDQEVLTLRSVYKAINTAKLYIQDIYVSGSTMYTDLKISVDGVSFLINEKVAVDITENGITIN